MTDLERYLAQGRLLGCPADQMEHFATHGLTLHPRQLEASAAARLCDQPDGPTEIGYGGARGGGKSFWLLAQMGADDCQRVPGLKCLLLRKVGKANVENFDDLRRRVFQHLDHDFSAHRGELLFANGSRILAGHFQHESDLDAYLGLEYDVIGIEEATTLTHRKFLDISTCCRTSKIQADGIRWRPRLYSTTNPGGVGHLWYKNRYLAPLLEHRPSFTRFIRAGVTDNTFVNPEYRLVLDRLTGWQKRAWLDGDWDIAAGQFFSNFRRDVHVLTDFDESRAREWFGALDYGFAHYTVFLLACKDGDGNTIIVDEHARRQWLPQKHANAIYHLLTCHSIVERQLDRLVAGADVFSRQSNGQTIADEYRRCGFTLRRANTDRLNGWAEILRGLGDPARGLRPSLFIHQRCQRLIENLTSLMHDPNRPEDVLKVDVDDDGNGGDDAADALRYALATKLNRIHVVRLRGL